MLTKEKITTYFKSLQDNICDAIASSDGKGKFRSDMWERQGGGGGDTRILNNGQVIEKGGVNFSAVFGEIPEALKQKMDFKGEQFYATGVSIVIHPHSPMVPIIHMNVRYFETDDVFWFGGGIDLTPHYIEKSQATFFHQKLKAACDKHHPNYYPEFKRWADEYFYITHRQETRGIGGIFFDHLSENQNFTKEDRFDFIKSVGESFAPIYTHLMTLNRDKSYSEKEKLWQKIRRGRYVEFNLVYDKGTKFGLETSGRIESILMSLPMEANWLYNFKPEKDSPEEDTLELLKKGINWLEH